MTIDLPTWNPFDPVLREDPYPIYARLRDENHAHPLLPLPKTVVISQYADCLAVFRHPAASNDETKGDMWQAMMEAQGGPTEEQERMLRRRPFLALDAPDHSRLRGLVQQAFTPRRIELLRTRVEALVAQAIDRVLPTGGMDVIADIAYPLPVTIISELLGVPVEDHEIFASWSHDLARSLDPDFILPPEVVERARVAGEEFEQYFSDLIERRRSHPGEDLISALIVAEEAGDRLTKDELLATLVLLLIAGHETTVNLIANGMLALLRHPGELAALRADPGLARPAVEEALRYDPPVQIDVRTPLDDIPLPSGSVAPAGGLAFLLLGSANRDPRQFADPDRFDIRRDNNHHLSFGFGAHHCLGAPLARLEAQVALRELAGRLEGVTLAVGEPQYKDNLILRGLVGLPVTFQPVG